MRVLLSLLLLVLSALQPAAAAQALPAEAKRVYQQALDDGRFASRFTAIASEAHATSDGKSYYLVWKAVPNPKHWIVSLHGTGGYATDDLALWYPNVKDRDVGVISVQWWLGGEQYYPPMLLYREIDQALKEQHLAPGGMMLHGFSRGSAYSYALAALDAGRGGHYFSLFVANSGGMTPDFPPNKDIVNGRFGDHPLKGTQWITVAGARDAHPDRDGIPAMRRTAEWLKEQGAVVVEAIEDPTVGHGALMLNPANAKDVLDRFLGAR